MWNSHARWNAYVAYDDSPNAPVLQPNLEGLHDKPNQKSIEAL